MESKNKEENAERRRFEKWKNIEGWRLVGEIEITRKSNRAEIWKEYERLQKEELAPRRSKKNF